MPGDTLPNPDFMIRRLRGKIFLGPTTRRGEDWLAATTRQPRPYKEIDPSECKGRCSFLATEQTLPEILGSALNAGVVFREQVFRFHDECDDLGGATCQP